MVLRSQKQQHKSPATVSPALPNALDNRFFLAKHTNHPQRDYHSYNSLKCWAILVSTHQTNNPMCQPIIFLLRPCEYKRIALHEKPREVKACRKGSASPQCLPIVVFIGNLHFWAKRVEKWQHLSRPYNAYSCRKSMDPSFYCTHRHMAKNDRSEFKKGKKKKWRDTCKRENKFQSGENACFFGMTHFTCKIKMNHESVQESDPRVTQNS